MTMLENMAVVTILGLVIARVVPPAFQIRDTVLEVGEDLPYPTIYTDGLDRIDPDGNYFTEDFTEDFTRPQSSCECPPEELDDREWEKCWEDCRSHEGEPLWSAEDPTHR